LTFQEGSIGIWTYNIETILAEKVETIMRRGELNTRPRDFYDVYVLAKTQEFNRSTFLEALKATIEHRETTHVLNDLSKRYNEIGSSKPLEKRWENYTKNYSYAQGISYQNVIDAVGDLLQHLK
jgi:predicted nucleotidyltransferase component of viral defense system